MHQEEGPGLGSILLTVLVVTVIGVALWAINITVIQPANRKTINNDANYQMLQENWFREKKAAIDSYDTQIATAESEKATFEKTHPNLGALDYNDQQRYQNLNTTIQGLKNQQVSAINEYNAASDNPDKGKWRGVDLPKHINPPASR